MAAIRSAVARTALLRLGYFLSATVPDLASALVRARRLAHKQHKSIVNDISDCVDSESPRHVLGHVGAPCQNGSPPPLELALALALTTQCVEHVPSTPVFCQIGQFKGVHGQPLLSPFQRRSRTSQWASIRSSAVRCRIARTSCPSEVVTAAGIPLDEPDEAEVRFPRVEPGSNDVHMFVRFNSHHAMVSQASIRLRSYWSPV